jgi:hypothetical protein
MDVEKLSKSSFVDFLRGEPTIRFTNKGVVYLNHAAVKHLKLLQGSVLSSVSICRDNKCHADFGIFKDSEGWCLRPGPGGGMMFNNVGLARHVIDATWDRCQSHPVGAEKPQSVVFRIARLPLDDGKNKDVFALLRKK